MARELVEKGGVGESADSVWRELERERAMHAPEQAADREVAAPPEAETSITAAEAPQDLAFAAPDPQPAGLNLVHSTPRPPKRKETPIWPTARIAGKQMSLFG
jgi:hypothetical protein